MSKKFLLCPLCAVKPEVYKISVIDDEGDYEIANKVSCLECGIEIVNESLEELADIWNNRPEIVSSGEKSIKEEKIIRTLEWHGVPEIWHAVIAEEISGLFLRVKPPEIEDS